MSQTKNKSVWKIIVYWFCGTMVCLILLFFLLLWIGFYLLEEPRKVEGKFTVIQMATTCRAFYKEDGNTNRCVLENLAVDSSQCNAPGSCRPTNYFRYSVKDLGDSKISFIATRCAQGGKNLRLKSPIA